MGHPLILTFDVGTQSTRCLLVRPDGSFADLCQVKHNPPYYSRNPGWAEQADRAFRRDSRRYDGGFYLY